MASRGPVAPTGGFRIGGVTYRTGEKVPARYARAVEHHRDPATGIDNAAPNFGRDVIPQIITFGARNTTWANVYRNSDEAVRHSLESARAMRNDCSIMECLEARQRATALLNWHLEPENPKSPRQKRLAENLTKIITRIPRFVEFRRNCLEALWYGRYANQSRFGVAYKNGQRSVYIKGWKPINGDKLAFRYDDGRAKFSDDDLGIRVLPGYGVKDAIGGDRKIEFTEFGPAYFLEPWERKMVTLHRHIIEDGSYEDPLSAGRIHGVGIRDRIYWTWYQKQETLAQMMELVERTGNGITIYRYPYGNPEAKAAVEEAAKQQKYTNVLLMPSMAGDPSLDAFDVNQLPVQTGGVQMLKEVLQEHFGHAIKRYILGQILSTEAAATGMGSGVADLHMESFMQIIHYDARNLEETLTTDLVGPLKEYNDPAARDIEIRFVIDTESPESEKKLQAYRQAWEMGLPIKANDIAGIIGASLPTKNDTVLPMNPAITQAQQQAAMDAAGGAGGMPGAGGAGVAGGVDPDSPEHLFGPIANLENLESGQDDGRDDGQGGDSELEQAQAAEQSAKYSKQKTLAIRQAVQNAACETDCSPTEAQRKSGNYRKGRVRLHGFDIAIETPKGVRRSPSWPAMAAHYGYIKRTISEADGDHVDVFIGPAPESQLVYVVDQSKQDGKFDEHKCMLGFTNINDARDAYLDSYGPGWKLGPITVLTIYQFACWLVTGETGRPICDQLRSIPAAITKRSSAVIRYAMAATAPQHNVGEIKVEAGKTYELNQNHRWQNKDGDEPGESPVGGQQENQQPEFSLEDRKAFSKQQLGKVHPKAANLFRSFHSAPEFGDAGEYQSADVHPEVAGKLHEWLSQNIGGEVGGGKVAELEDGRLGFSSPAGAFTLGKDASGNWQSHYTVMTGPVSEAMTKAGQKPGAGSASGDDGGDAGDLDDDYGPETEIETLDQGDNESENPDGDDGDGDVIETAEPAEDDLPGNDPTSGRNDPNPQQPPAKPPIAKPPVAAAPPRQPVAPTAPAVHPQQSHADELRSRANEAKSELDLANQEWREAAKIGISPKQSAWHRARVSALRSIYNDHHRSAGEVEKGIAKDAKESAKNEQAAAKNRQRQPAHSSAPAPHAPVSSRQKTPEELAHDRLGTNRLPRQTSQELRDRENAALDADYESKQRARGRGKNQGRFPDAGAMSPEEMREQQLAASLADSPSGPSYEEWTKDRPSSASTARKRRLLSHLDDHGFTADAASRDILQSAIEKGDLSSVSELRSSLRSARKILANGPHPEGPSGAIAEAVRRRKRQSENRQKRESWKDTLRGRSDYWGIEPEEYETAINDAFKEKRQNHAMREQAKDHARQATGLSQADINRLENQGLDYGSDHERIRGLDTVGRELAAHYPELGWGGGYNQDEAGGDDTDYAELLWNLIREGKSPLPSKQSPEFLDEVDAFLDHQFNSHRKPGAKKMSDEERQKMEAVPFQKVREKYGKWLENVSRYGKNWSEEDHPRGQPDNAGKFAPKGGGVNGFREWFGNSKISLSGDKPRKVYTGQPKGLKEIPATERSEFPVGHAFFTTSRDVAEMYAGTHESERRGDTDYSLGKDGQVYEAYLSIQKPFDLDKMDEDLWAKYLLPDVDVENEGYSPEDIADAIGFEKHYVDGYDRNGNEARIHAGWDGPGGEIVSDNSLPLEDAVRAMWGNRSGSGDTLEDAISDSPSGMAMVLFRKAAKKLIASEGYDGLVFADSEMGGTTIVPLSGNQIRLADSQST